MSCVVGSRYKKEAAEGEFIYRKEASKVHSHYLMIPLCAYRSKIVVSIEKKAKVNNTAWLSFFPPQGLFHPSFSPLLGLFAPFFFLPQRISRFFLLVFPLLVPPQLWITRSYEVARCPIDQDIPQ